MYSFVNARLRTLQTPSHRQPKLYTTTRSCTSYNFALMFKIYSQYYTINM